MLDRIDDRGLKQTRYLRNLDPNNSILQMHTAFTSSTGHFLKTPHGMAASSKNVAPYWFSKECEGDMIGKDSLRSKVRLGLIGQKDKPHNGLTQFSKLSPQQPITEGLNTTGLFTSHLPCHFTRTEAPSPQRNLSRQTNFHGTAMGQSPKQRYLDGIEGAWDKLTIADARRFKNEQNFKKRVLREKHEEIQAFNQMESIKKQHLFRFRHALKLSQERQADPKDLFTAKQHHVKHFEGNQGIQKGF